MKCQNCGAEIPNDSRVCNYCGNSISVAMLKEQEQLNIAGCPRCKSTNISFSREKQREIKKKKKIEVVRETIGVCKDCGYTWTTTENCKKDNLKWWILGWIFCFPIPLTILIWRNKCKWDKKVKIGVTAALWGFILLLGIINDNGSSTDTTNNTISTTIESGNKEAVSEQTNNTNSISTQTSTEEKYSNDVNDELKVELYANYGIDAPSLFVRGDNTGKWKIVKVANTIAPSEYAVDYAKAYMTDGDIHYIVNFTLKTTTQLHLILGKLSVKTTEYVDKEEHDASIIGEGQLLTEKYFDMETEKEIVVETDASAGTVDKDTLIAKVKEVIEGQVGNGEKITGVSFDGKDILITVDMSEAETKYFTKKEIAESRISSITDAILNLEDKYYNTWETVTLDFGKEGKVTLDKSRIKDHGFGKYFDFPSGILN